MLQARPRVNWVERRAHQPQREPGHPGQNRTLRHLREVCAPLAHLFRPGLAVVLRVPHVSTALATALDVGLSNWSFLYITVSL